MAFFTGKPGLCITRRLVGGGFEMLIPKPAFSSFHQDNFLSVFQNFADNFAFFVSGDSSYGNFDINIFTVGSGKLVFGTVHSAFRFYVTGVAKREQRPFMGISLHDNVAASSAVPTIRS